MARPGQATHRKRKREAEEAIARAQSWGGSTNTSYDHIPSSSSTSIRASLPTDERPSGYIYTGKQVADLEDEEVGDDVMDEDNEEENGDDDEDEDGDEDFEDEDVEIEGRGSKGKEKGKKEKKGGAQVLPVADLPEDWDGDVEDGATYLALAMRADKALPTYTRVENPWKDDLTSTTEPEARTDPTSGSSRHPALPKEAWQTVFPLHFVAYKKTIAESWPPSPPLPYPRHWPKIPPTSQRGEWGYYINGQSRRPLPPPAAPVSSKGKGKAKAVEYDEEEGLNGGIEDEEAGLNAGAGGSGGKGGKEEDDDTDMDLDDGDEEEAAMNLPQVEVGLEPLGEKHKKRDPHVCILQKLDTSQIISVLSTLTTHIQNTLTPLESNLIPPSYDPLTASSSYRPHTRKNPYSEHYSRWIYALLIVLDPFLSAAQVSVLRELSRVIMRVGAWRWVEAVVSGEVGLPAGVTDDTEGSETQAPWVLGARWKYGRDSREANGEIGRDGKGEIGPNEREEYDETGVDETLARCWLVVHAVSAGWGQKDLVMDLENMFS